MAGTDNLGLVAALVQILDQTPDRAEKIKEPNICKFHFDCLDQGQLTDYLKKYVRSELKVDPYYYIKDIHMLKKMEPE